MTYYIIMTPGLATDAFKDGNAVTQFLADVAGLTFAPCPHSNQAFVLVTTHDISQVDVQASLDLHFAEPVVLTVPEYNQHFTEINA